MQRDLQISVLEIQSRENVAAHVQHQILVLHSSKVKAAEIAVGGPGTVLLLNNVEGTKSWRTGTLC